MRGGGFLKPNEQIPSSAVFKQAGFAGLNALLTLGLAIIGVSGFLYYQINITNNNGLSILNTPIVHKTAKSQAPEKVLAANVASQASNNASAESGKVLAASDVSLIGQIQNVLNQYLAEGKFVGPKGDKGDTGLALGFSGASGMVQNGNGQTTSVIGGTPIVTYIPATQNQNFTGGSLAGFTNLSAGSFVSGNTTINGSINISGAATASSFTSTGNTTLASTTLATLTVTGNTIISNGLLSFGSTLTPTLKGSYTSGANDGVWRDVVVQGKYAYISSGNNGMEILDISNPSSPVLVGSISSVSFGTGVAVAGSYAYFADGSTHLRVVDISNPSVPTVVGAYAPCCGFSVGTPYVSGKYVYLATGNAGFEILDISKPTTPTLLSSTNAGGNSGVNAVYVNGHYAYVTRSSTHTMTVYDVTIPTAPTVVGTYTNAGLDAYMKIYVSGRYAFVTNGTGGGNQATSNQFLYIIDVSNPASPSLVTTVAGNFYGLQIDSNRLYLADYVNGLDIYDISTITNPVLVGNYSVSSGIIGLSVVGRYAYVTTKENPGRFLVIDLKGLDVATANIGNLQSANLWNSNNLTVGNSLYVGTGLNVGKGGIMTDGRLSVGDVGYFGSVLSVGNTTTPVALLSIQGFSGSTTPEFIVASSTNATHLIVTSAGNVGIGTSTASQQLEVSGGSGSGNVQIDGSGTFPVSLIFNDTTVSNYPTYSFGIDHRASITGFTDGTAFSLFNHNPTTGSYVWPIAVGNDRLTDQSNVWINRYVASATSTVSIDSWTQNPTSAGVVIHNSGLGNVLQVQSSLYVDHNGKVGIGTTSPDSSLTVSANPAALLAPPTTDGVGNTIQPLIHVGGANGQEGAIVVDGYGLPGTIIGRRSNGTAASPVSLAFAGYNMFYFQTSGYTSAGAFSNPQPAFGVANSQAWTASNQGTQMTFYTTANNATTSTARMFLDNAGNIGIGTITPTSTLFVQGSGTINPFVIASSSGAQLLTVTSGGNLNINGGSLLINDSTGVYNGATMSAVANASTSDFTINFPSASGSVGPLDYYAILRFNGAQNKWYFGADNTRSYMQTGVSHDMWFSPGSGGRAALDVPTMVLTSGTFVGIGTATPTTKVAIQGSAGTDILDVASSTGISLFRITKTGNVGIGTTSPSDLLVVARPSTANSTGGITISNGSNSGYGGALTFAGTNGSSYNFSRIYSENNSTGGALVFQTANTSGVLTTAFSIDSSQNPSFTKLGIGKTPDANVILDIKNSSLGIGLQLDGTSYGGSKWQLGDGLAGGNGTFNIKDVTNNATRLSINSTGNVGIGTTSPTALLDVEGSGILANFGGTGSSAVNINSSSVNPLEVHSNFAQGISLYTHSNTYFRAPQINFIRTGGTQSSPTGVLSGNDLGHIIFLGYNGSSYVQSPGIVATAEENWSSTTSAANLTFSTNPTGTVNNSVERMRITGSGNVGIGTTTPTAGLHVGSASAGMNVKIANGYLCVDNNDTCTGASTAGTVYAVGTYTTGADVAENYPTRDTSLEAGDVVMADGTSPIYVKKANGSTSLPSDALGLLPSPGEKGTQGNILGIISTKPGVLLNGYKSEDFKTASSVPVALAGRVPVKISAENGNIKIGDYLTVSKTLPGFAMKAKEAGNVLGRALENFPPINTDSNQQINTDNKGVILVFIQPTYYQPKVADLIQSTANQSADVTWLASLTNLNMTNASVFGDIAVTGSVAIQKDLRVGGVVYAAELDVDLVKAKKVEAQQLCTEEVCINKEQLKALLKLLDQQGTVLGSSVVLPAPTPAPAPTTTSTPETVPPVQVDSTSTPPTSPDGSHGI